MERGIARRSLLAGAVATAAAGCLGVDADDWPGDGGDATEEGDGRPDPCHVTQGLDVEWPGELSADAVATFVATYEDRYYRDVVLEYEPGSRLDDYRLDASVRGDPEARADGYVATVDGAGAVYRPNLEAVARVADAPDGREQVSDDAIEDGSLRSLLAEAVDAAENDGSDDETAQEGDDQSGPDVAKGFDSDAEVDAFLDQLASSFDNFDGLDGPNESATLYFDVDGTDVELAVASDTFHGDYWWQARYYVDERVVRRTDDEDVDPRDGDLLECRDVP